MIAKGQGPNARRARLRNNCCPVHGIAGVPSGAKPRQRRIVLMCPRKGCAETFLEAKPARPAPERSGHTLH